MPKAVVELKKISPEVEKVIVSRRAISVLELLYDYPEGLSAREIADKLNMYDDSIKTVALNRLKKAGFVINEQRKWKLTRKGKRIIKALVEDDVDNFDESD